MTTNWRVFSVYMLIIVFMILASSVVGQIKVVQYNAEWNKTNDIAWVQQLEEVKTISYVDISKDVEAQTKHKIAVIPTIIIFKDGEEVFRFQADLSFKMIATREEVQEEIDNQLMSDF